MAQRGRKVANPDSKKLAGTFRKDRHADIVTLSVVAKARPKPPEWLTDGAKEIWVADLPRALATGLDAIDTHVFALYCETMASFIASTKAGAAPNAAFRAELRRQLEALGMGGAKSRLVKMAAPEADKSNPFSVRK